MAMPTLHEATHAGGAGAAARAQPTVPLATAATVTAGSTAPIDESAAEASDSGSDAESDFELWAREDKRSVEVPLLHLQRRVAAADATASPVSTMSPPAGAEGGGHARAAAATLLLTQDVDGTITGSALQTPSHGQFAWDAAYALGMVVQDSNLFPGQYFAGKRVIELGAGIGLPGLVLAGAGARVTLTDQVSALLLRSNRTRAHALAHLSFACSCCSLCNCCPLHCRLRCCRCCS